MAHGSGPGPIAEDGSAVEYYLVSPADDASARLVHDALPEGASVLDLGSGTGRVSAPLRELGHPVTAVDASADMLAHVPAGIRTVRSGIEELALDERFDCVLLMSFLVNYGDRDALLASCRRHVSDGGRVLIQREPDGFFDEFPREWTGRNGVRTRLSEVVPVGPGTVTATLEYDSGDRAWSHTFTTRRLGDDELPEVLGKAGLRLDGFLTEDRTWVVARPLP
ncbi:class I SAM-dependent methyltransferase [Actinomadura logoneensis]|uniref:Class I SAM-dependent methyltransferase n=1 Tax=Actinomadura logoneensis TaxID=2293572 RepID=A0A372J9I7_9ACTN|nr:class I SAM-dependent methyltransferase [Actinomadura logoneensis]RFU36671.1 class I SAM-dependent methyltransferase [Actinomadura logoneensis]